MARGLSTSWVASSALDYNASTTGRSACSFRLAKPQRPFATGFWAATGGSTWNDEKAWSRRNTRPDHRDTGRRLFRRRKRHQSLPGMDILPGSHDHDHPGLPTLRVEITLRLTRACARRTRGCRSGAYLPPPPPPLLPPPIPPPAPPSPPTS